MKNYFIADLESLNLTKESFFKNEYQKKDYDKEKTELQAIFGSYCDLVDYFSVSEQDGVNYPEHIRTILFYDGLFLVPYKSKNMYEFFTRLDFLDFYRGFEYDKEKPQKIGVATDKKIRAWWQYLLDEQKEKTLYACKIDKKIREFMEEIKLSGENLEIKEDYRSISGEIVRGGIQYTFNVDKSNGSISQRVMLHYKNDWNIKTFTKLANNQTNY